MAIGHRQAIAMAVCIPNENPGPRLVNSVRWARRRTGRGRDDLQCSDQDDTTNYDPANGLRPQSQLPAHQRRYRLDSTRVSVSFPWAVGLGVALPEVRN